MHVSGSSKDLAGKGGLTKTVRNEAGKRFSGTSLNEIINSYLGRNENAHICLEIEQLSAQIGVEKNPEVKQMLTSALNSIFSTLEQEVANKKSRGGRGFRPPEDCLRGIRIFNLRK